MELFEEIEMHTMFTTAIARQIVADRVSAADSTRRARLFGRKAASAASAESGSTERVAKAPRAAQSFRSDLIGAH